MPRKLRFKGQEYDYNGPDDPSSMREYLRARTSPFVGPRIPDPTEAQPTIPKPAAKPTTLQGHFETKGLVTQYRAAVPVDTNHRKDDAPIRVSDDWSTNLASKLPTDFLRKTGAQWGSILNQGVELASDPLNYFGALAAPKVMSRAPVAAPKMARESTELMRIPQPVAKAKPQTRFYQGRAGTVDAKNPPKVDIGGHVPRLGALDQGTTLAREHGNLTIPDPTITAEMGPSLGRPREYREYGPNKPGQIELEDVGRSADYQFPSPYERQTSADQVTMDIGRKGSQRLESPLPDIPVPEIPNSPLPAGTQSRLRALGHSEEAIQQMDIQTANVKLLSGKVDEVSDLRQAELMEKFGGRLKSETDALRIEKRGNPPRDVIREVDDAVKRGAPVDRDVVVKAAESKIPEVQKAAEQVAETQIKNESRWRRWAARARDPKGVWRDIGMGSLEGVKRSGKTGPEIHRKVTFARLEGERTGGTWSSRARQVAEPETQLNPEQYNSLQRAMDLGEPVFDPKVQTALDEVHKIDDEMTRRATAADLHIKTSSGEKVPFKGRENYWPHIYPKEFFADKVQAIKKLIDSGMSPKDAEETLRNSFKYGERLISPEHARRTNSVPGYRTDFNALLQHYDDMGKRIAEAEEFGSMDIGDAASPLGRLVKGTDDPEFVTRVLQRHLGREEAVGAQAAWGKMTKKILKVEAAMHLSQFAIGNSQQLAAIPLKANSARVVEGLVKGLTKEGKITAERSGVLQTIHQEALREYGGESLISKLFLMKKSEGYNRAVAAIAGQGTVKDVFNKLKSGKGGEHDKTRLFDLLQENVDKVMKQGELSEAQLGRAGGRMAELTQGRAQSIDLPPFWTNHPAFDMVFLYKKYAFRQGKVMKDALMTGSPAQRAKNLAIVAAIFPIVGEAAGDVKATIKGAIQGDIGKAVRDRADYIGTDSPIINRFIANYMQVWTLGLLGEAVQASSSGQAGLLKFVSGPVLSDATEVAGAVGTGNINTLEKKAAASVPYVGSGLRANVAENQAKQNKIDRRNKANRKRVRSGRAPLMPRPPSLPHP